MQDWKAWLVSGSPQSGFEAGRRHSRSKDRLKNRILIVGKRRFFATLAMVANHVGRQRNAGRDAGLSGAAGIQAIPGKKPANRSKDHLPKEASHGPYGPDAPADGARPDGRGCIRRPPNGAASGAAGWAGIFVV
jgi:hypothetical protein